ncbi:hypothetical protein [Alysiella crassa]|uniref:hypothetical protein n=1 Tax=Alysiella crassa TaxID=153491 RepID=UPI0012EC70A9|nr:hypothetical protein [Alysiella crassa]UOP07331.1 hypothetical protein LVJ80_02520 [Alysiella crassa]
MRTKIPTKIMISWQFGAHSAPYILLSARTFRQPYSTRQFFPSQKCRVRHAHQITE